GGARARARRDASAAPAPRRTWQDATEGDERAPDGDAVRMPALRLAAATQPIGESLYASPPAPVVSRERTGDSIGID
ncbi:hypothetical protein AAHH80_41865, partial [Burkholderia pseudomallei]